MRRGSHGSGTTDRHTVVAGISLIGRIRHTASSPMVLFTENVASVRAFALEQAMAVASVPVGSPNREREFWLRRCLSRVWSCCLRCGEAQTLEMDALGVYANCPSCAWLEPVMNWESDWIKP